MRMTTVMGMADRWAGTSSGRWLRDRVDVFARPSTPLETAVFLDAFLPSLMPRTSVHQGLAAGLDVLTARGLSASLLAVGGRVGAGAGLGVRTAIHLAEFGLGHAAASLPESEGETLWRSGVRSVGDVLRAAAVGAALVDGVAAFRTRGLRNAALRPALTGAVLTTGVALFASRRLAVRRSEIQRWPVDQQAAMLPATGVAAAVTTVGTGAWRAFRTTGAALRRTAGPGLAHQLVGTGINAAAWVGGIVLAYNGGVAMIGRANERLEHAFAVPPSSPLCSGSAESFSPFAELGQQGRRFVSEAVTTESIGEVTGEPAVAEPIRAFVGFNTAPLYQAGRAELALAELDRTGAFDRSYLLLVSPTGTGWVDQAVVAAAEYLTRGDLATCSIQYGRFPSFLCVQKVGLGRSQFRLLLWGIRERLAERPPERRPKILVFGESLGAWTASDVVMTQGIVGFDHYGIDRALWFGLPGLAKWSRNGMTTGASDLVPPGTVEVFDTHEQLAGLDDEARERLRAVILSHDNDPIAALRPELLVRRPSWLGSERGRGVSERMDWIPFVTFWQIAIDAANAMVTVPGEFRSFGHDYRADTTRFVRDAYHLPVTDERVAVRIDEELRRRELARSEAMGAPPPDGAEPLRPTERFSSNPFAAGIPVATRPPTRSRWLRASPTQEAKAHDNADGG